MDKIQARAALFAKMQAYIKAHDTMSDENVSEYESMEKEYEALDKAIKRDEAMATREKELTAPTSTPVPNGEAPKAEDDKLADFRNYLKGHGGIPAAQNAMTVGTDADGGYLVPESYQRTVIEKLNAMGRTRSVSNVIATSSTVKVPTEGAAPTFAWIAEGGAYGETDSDFGLAVIDAHKYGGIIKVSEELLQDNMINFDGYMTSQIAKGMDKAEAAAFAVGDGTGKPTGYVTGATVGANSITAVAGAVTADELIDIYYDLKEEYRANATWRMNDKTEKSIRKLKDGNGNYLYAPSLNAGERPTLLGAPIVIDNGMADLATGNKFIAIGDFSYYQIADRGAMSIQRLNELYAGTGFVGFKVTARVDGKVTMPEAFNIGQSA